MTTHEPKSSSLPLVLLLAAVIILIAENVILIAHPTNPADQRVLAIIGLAMGFIALILTVLALSNFTKLKKTGVARAAKLSVVAPPKPISKAEVSSEQAVILLTLLQEKGRFVDFVMEDVAPYSNEQVGAAARVVHQGCREVILESFDPKPITEIKENSEVVLDQGFNTTEYRLVGKVGGPPPYKGKLVHPGWRAQCVKLPRPNFPAEDADTPVVQPAEVSL